MTRPVYTVLYSLFIVGLFFSLSFIYQSCGKNKPEALSTEELADKVEEIADSHTEESFFEDDDNFEAEQVLNDSENNEGNQEDARQEDVSYAEQTSVPSANYTEGYIVIAGNYLLESNASEMVKRLKAAGYNNAEKVVFDLSQYYTVIAGTYDSRSIANSISSELNGKGIDNYVLRRKN